ncbi:MAG: hypothetical protein LUG14_14800 [Synergistaceae bacterium]|nr:hypothetical protein [Synergistaceae bacterium]
MRKLIVSLLLIFTFTLPCAADGLVYLFSTEDFAFYTRDSLGALDSGQFLLVEFIQNTISAKAIRAFRGATGGLEPGYSLAYAAFHKQSPRWQVTKIIYITDDGRQYTQNYGYSPNAWDKIPTNVPLFKIWQHVIHSKY